MKVYRAVGRRKDAVAQVRLVSPGSGKVSINDRELHDYLPVEVWRNNAIRPMEVTKTNGNFDIFVIVKGGGKSGQTGAIQLGIARCLVESDEELRPKLRQAGMLTRDPRMVERKKYGQKKARKRFQFSKR
jgi:small subunit ribosomal protein S9